MTSKNQVVVKNTAEVRRTFNYTKGETSLNFQLRIDILAELQNFEELLASALADVTAQIEQIKNKK